MSGFKNFGENGEKNTINHFFTTTEQYENFFEKTNMIYDAKDFDLEGDVLENGGKIFDSKNGDDYGERSDYKSKTREFIAKKSYVPTDGNCFLKCVIFLCGYGKKGNFQKNLMNQFSFNFV